MVIFKQSQELVIIFGLLLMSTMYAQLVEQKSLVDVLVFSYDRPMQLDAYLRSLQVYTSGNYAVYVLYRASTDDFERAYQEVKKDYTHVLFVRQTLDQSGKEDKKEDKNDFKNLTLRLSFEISQAPYIMYAVDDIISTDFFHLDDCIQALEKERAYAFYLRMGKNITQSHASGHNTDHPLPPLEITPQGFLSWQFSTGILEWAYPNTLDMAIYRKADIEQLVRRLHFTSPNTFEGLWASTADHSKKALSYQKSKIVNIPDNKVQEDGQTPHMNAHTARQLLDMFNQGLRIDIAPLHKIENKAPHMEYVLAFK